MSNLPVAILRAECRVDRAEQFQKGITKMIEAEYNYEDIRNFAVLAFGNHYRANLGNDRANCVRLAAEGMHRSSAFVYRWVMDFESGENFFTEYKWGKNSKTPFKLADITLFAECSAWCRARNGHRRGQPNLTVTAFKRLSVVFVDLVLSCLALVLIFVLTSSFPRYLEETHNLVVCQSSATDYMHRLGGTWESVSKGHYVDAHEEPHALIQEAEFLDNYAYHYQRGPNFLCDDVDKDRIKEVSKWIEEGERHPRGFSLAGRRHSKHTGPLHIIFCDDEVCVFAQDGERYCWRFDGCTKGQTPAKNRGAARHVAGLVWEGGNGHLTMNLSVDSPDSSEQLADFLLITTLTEMRQYCNDKAQGLNPIIPRNANVMMKPGKNDEGWWAGLEKQMQMILASDIFNVVFNTELDLSLPIRVNDLESALVLTRLSNDGELPYKLCVQLDRSQNHLCKFPHGLCASKMRKGRNLKRNNPHIRSTRVPKRVGDIERAINCLSDGSCEICKKEVADFGGESQVPEDWQCVGWKGLELVCMERGIPTQGKLVEDLAIALSKQPDFLAELSAVLMILRDAGARARCVPCFRSP